MTNKNWNIKEKAEFLKRIGLLMQRGYSLANSLELYSLNERKDIQHHIRNILEQLKNGERICDILERFKFPNDIIASLYFFEHYDLSKGFIHSGQLLEKRVAFKERLQKILQYPLFLIWLTSIMVYLLFRYLLPQFSNLYNSIGSELPKTSQVIIVTVKSIPFVFICIGIFIFTFAIIHFLKIRHQSPRAKLLALFKFPLIRTFIKLFVTHRFSLNLSSLLHAGISINEAIHIFERQTYSLFFQQEANEVKYRLLSGESLEDIMHNRSLYQEELAAIIKHGQMNGNLADELIVYADILFLRIEERIIKTLNIIQPIIFTIVGLIILLMFLAVMLPMLQFIQSL